MLKNGILNGVTNIGTVLVLHQYNVVGVLDQCVDYFTPLDLMLCCIGIYDGNPHDNTNYGFRNSP
jgi:hypothetical protein